MLPQRDTKSTKDKFKLGLELILRAFVPLWLIVTSEDSDLESESGSALAHSAMVWAVGFRSDSDSVPDSPQDSDSELATDSGSASCSALLLSDLLLPFLSPLASS